MKITLKVWRQDNQDSKGQFEKHTLTDLTPNLSLFEVVDMVNENLIGQNKRPIEFDHDCREGICGQCGVWINGQAHGPGEHQTSCQVYLRQFKDCDTITIEPFRARSFPIKKDLKIDRSAFDRIIAAGGFISVNPGQAPDAHAIPVSFVDAETALDAASCIGCGACVASCKNASASLFTGAKVAHLAQLPQGKPEAAHRVKAMVEQMDTEGFGACSVTGACEAVCPQQISLSTIVAMNKEYLKAL